MDIEIVHWCSYVILMSGVLCLLAYMFERPSRYGKHKPKDLKAQVVGARLGWVIQECPSFMIPVYVVLKVGLDNINTPNLIIISLFALHYFQRSFLYPLFMRKNCTPLPLYLCVAGFTYCSINGFAIAEYEASYGKLRDDWLQSPQFLIGVLIWTLGLLINMHSDHILRNLRKPHETGYKIPRGGAFEFVSGANYFGEIVEWYGLAIASKFHLPVICFALSVSAVIGTRALSHHKFYLSKFEDYPKNRKAIIPFLL